jgi:hypothetical protein
VADLKELITNLQKKHFAEANEYAQQIEKLSNDLQAKVFFPI